MEQGSTWIAEWVNSTLVRRWRPSSATSMGCFGYTYTPGHMIIPEHVTFAGLVFLFCAVFSQSPGAPFLGKGRIQQILELVVEFLNGQLEEIIGHGAKRYLPMVATIGIFILLMNLCGQIPGFASPTSSINVTVGCAPGWCSSTTTTWEFESRGWFPISSTLPVRCP